MKISIVISFLLGLAIVYLAWQRLEFKEERVAISAVVTDINDVKNNQKVAIHFNKRVTVSFQPSRHEMQQASFITKKPITFEIDDTIEIYYSPKNKQRIEWKEE